MILVALECGRAQREPARNEPAVADTAPVANETFVFTERDLDDYARGRAGTATEDQTVPEAAAASKRDENTAAISTRRRKNSEVKL